MSFENTERWLAFDPAQFDSSISQWNQNLGVMGRDGNEQFRTIISGWDDASHTRKRGGWYEPEGSENTILPTPLTDGRIAILGLWNDAFIAAIEAGEIEAEELNAEPVEELKEEGE